ncbi:hypothetical protein [Salinispora tropica]|uniref:Lipoprotein n=1 Tax=Salinispora tropica (strain ATCC BAA-916 / DSM 44818 / JCM 13857 / NBRC 105044 / CNB-440) TaxID=369723 RepID=A4XBS9_SALTO|nr:hypothetical protein [Salinispora tropica]ABP56386.1 hypothetical protein Strop_3956 [Salinispora tropica CNB-440]
MSRWKKLSVLAVAAVTAVSMTACGPNDSEGESGALERLTDDIPGSLQAAADKAKETETVRADMVTSGGAADSEMQMTMDFRGAVSFEMVGDILGEPVTMRMVDSAIYTENSAEDRELYNGKRWTKIDLDSSPEGDVGVDQMLQESDPSQQIETLLELEGVTVAGEETVDGIRTVQYTVTTTPEKLAEAQPEGSAESSDLSAAGDALGVTEVTIDVWIDEEYLLRRFRMDMGTAGVTTADYYDYNEPAQIEAPPAADVVDLEEVFADLEGSFAELEDAMKEIEDLTGGN